MQRLRVALFIDAENASSDHLPDYLARCRELGKPTIARCYGGTAGLKKWEKAIAEHHLMPMLTPSGGGKENASDFALTIDAVSLLHRGLFDHAVIASSDADFAQLAIHIRENGKGVDGIGEAKATKSLRTAFDTFTEVLAAAGKPGGYVPPPAKAAAAALATPVNAREQLLATYRRLSQQGRVTLATFGKAFKQDHPDIALGRGKLKKHLLAVDLAVNDKQEVTEP